MFLKGESFSLYIRNPVFIQFVSAIRLVKLNLLSMDIVPYMGFFASKRIE